MLVATVWAFQDNETVARLAFLPAVAYFLLNQRAIRALEKVGPTPKQVIEESRYVKLLVVALFAAEIATAYYAVASGERIDDYLYNFGALLLALIGPLLPALIVSQILLYRRLGDEDF